MREYGKEIENLKHILQEFKINEIKSCLYFTHDTKPIYMFSETAFKQHEAEIRKPLEDEIERLKNKLVDLAEEYELTVEGFDRECAQQNVRLQKAFNDKYNERLKVIAELEEFICKNSKTRIISAYDDESEYDTERHINFQALKLKLKEMKGV